MRGKFLVKLNMGPRPIANKYREGKLKRTLKRESKVLEIVKREAACARDCVMWESTRAMQSCRVVSAQVSACERVILIDCLPVCTFCSHAANMNVDCTQQASGKVGF